MKQELNDEKIILDGRKPEWRRDWVEAWLRGERIAPITIDCAFSKFRRLIRTGMRESTDATGNAVKQQENRTLPENFC